MYLYHIKPNKIEGVELKPFSLLSSEIQEEYQKKYFNRTEIQKQKIPQLNANWSQVIHLSPVNLNDIKKEIKDIFGVQYTFSYYKIPIDVLKKDKLIVYLNQNKIHSLEEIDVVNEYVRLDNLDDYTKIPLKTKEYYKKCFKENISPLLFYGIPHIFYQGTIPINKIELIV
jgi:hypothetical protein